ncbi:MAG TPA: M23 family metallopeptidase [Candidatus Bathyarchaeia archaeon]|nr:M23 family metallopeptidase [Candidatus Bathyarchaeia archaeon]
MMINFHFSFGRNELQVKLGKKKGRPKKTLFTRSHNFYFYLKRVYCDKRFKGNKISRVFRRILELKKIKEFVGLNLALALFFLGNVSKPISAFNFAADAETIIYDANGNIKVTTEESIKAPLSPLQISQGYHPLHRAIDLKGKKGSLIYPLMRGTVESVIYSTAGYGNHLIINHDSGIKSLYAHLENIRVSENQEVESKTILGTVGMSGWTTGPHLHLEVWQNGEKINPMSLLK